MARHIPDHQQFSTRDQLFRDTDVFWLGEKTQRFFAAFTAAAAGFHSSERDTQVAREPAVYLNCAGVNLFGDAMGAIQVLGPDAGGETVIGVVGVADYFFFVVEWRDRDDGPENFFAISATCDRQTGDDCRRKEITFAAAIVDEVGRFPTEGGDTALFFGEVHVKFDLIELSLAHYRALLGFFVQRIANFQLRRFLDETIDEILVNGSLNEYSRTAQTNLALVRER